MFKTGDKVKLNLDLYIKNYIEDSGYPPTEFTINHLDGIKTVGEISPPFILDSE